MSCRLAEKHKATAALTNSNVGPADTLLAGFSLDTHDDEEAKDKDDGEGKKKGGERGSGEREESGLLARKRDSRRPKQAKFYSPSLSDYFGLQTEPANQHPPFIGKPPSSPVRPPPFQHLPTILASPAQN